MTHDDMIINTCSILSCLLDPYHDPEGSNFLWISIDVCCWEDTSLITPSGFNHGLGGRYVKTLNFHKHDI